MVGNRIEALCISLFMISSAQREYEGFGLSAWFWFLCFCCAGWVFNFGWRVFMSRNVDYRIDRLAVEIEGVCKAIRKKLGAA